MVDNLPTEVKRKLTTSNQAWGLPNWLYDRIKHACDISPNTSAKLLAERFNISPGILNSIRSGRRQPLVKPDANPASRCLECGALVFLPCVSCNTEKTTDLLGWEDGDDLIELHGLDYQRYMEVRKGITREQTLEEVPGDDYFFSLEEGLDDCSHQKST